MTDKNVIMDFPKCWNCGSEKIASQEAWKQINGEDNVPFTSADKLLLPLVKTTSAVTASLPVVPGCLYHSDYCGECGAYRLIRVEKASVPGQVYHQMMGGKQR